MLRIIPFLLPLALAAGCATRHLIILDRAGDPVPDAVVHLDYPSFTGEVQHANDEGVVHYSTSHLFDVIQVRVESPTRGRAVVSYPPPSLIVLNESGSLRDSPVLDRQPDESSLGSHTSPEQSFDWSSVSTFEVSSLEQLSNLSPTPRFETWDMPYRRFAVHITLSDEITVYGIWPTVGPFYPATVSAVGPISLAHLRKVFEEQWSMIDSEPLRVLVTSELPPQASISLTLVVDVLLKCPTRVLCLTPNRIAR